MGNNASSHSHYIGKECTLRELDSHNRDQCRTDWTKSLPSNIKSKSDRQEHLMWVLPTDIKHGLKLRSTMNGAIIQRGGTISGKNFNKHENNGDSVNVTNDIQFRRTRTMLQFDSHSKLASSAIQSVQETRESLEDNKDSKNASMGQPSARDATNMTEKKCNIYKKRKAPAVPQTATSAKCTIQMLDHQQKNNNKIMPHVRANGESLLLTPTSHSPRGKPSCDRLKEAAEESPDSAKMHRPLVETEFPPKNPLTLGMNWQPAKCTDSKTTKVENVDAEQAKVSKFSSIGDPLSSLLSSLHPPSGIVDEAIMVHVRPTLPRRQLDIPSFSPFTAWRLLRIEEKTLHRGSPLHTGTHGDGSDNRKSQVGEKLPAWDVLKHPRDKPNIRNTSWTPQQDLDDDDDFQQTEQHNEMQAIAQTTIKGGCKPFSSTKSTTTYVLSLPRERQIFSHLKNSISMNESAKCKSLEKARRDTGTTQSNTGPQTLIGNNNWFLHNSQPQIRSLDSQKLIQPASLAYVKSGKHSIYLPKDENSIGEQRRDPCAGFLSGSSVRASDAREHCGQRAKPLKRTKKDRQSMQDMLYTAANNAAYCPAELNQPSEGHNKVVSPNNRLSIQSTIITNFERRRANQKLIKDSQAREVQRQTGLEAMKRIEADVQWKRANEKAELRERMQMYLSTIDTNVLKNDDVQNCGSMSQRADPDGADSLLRSDRYVFS